MGQWLIPAPGVGVEYEDDAVYVAPLPDGPITVLEGVSALIWEEACDQDRAGLAERVAARTDRSADEIRGDLDAFVDGLVARRLLAVRN